MARYESKTITDTEAAYMAGIVDGEGSLTIGTYAKTKTGQPAWAVVLGISNTEEKLIDWLVSKFGGKKLTYTRAQLPRNSRKAVFRWQATGNRLRHICELILPYTTIKQRQVEIMLDMLSSLTQRDYRAGQRGPNVSQEIIDHRFQLAGELRSLHNRLAAVKHD